jgi:hypothetical protein
MTLALSQLERAIDHLKSQFDEMPFEYHKHITARLLNQYNVYIDLLNTLIINQKQHNKLQQMMDDITISETRQQHQKMLDEFKNTHDIKLQNTLKAVADKYIPTKYIVSYNNADVYSVADQSMNNIALELRDDLNKSIVESIKVIASNFLNTACYTEQQTIKSEFDKKIQNFTDELNSATDAIVNQCKLYMEFHSKKLQDLITKLDNTTKEYDQYSKQDE